MPALPVKMPPLPFKKPEAKTDDKKLVMSNQDPENERITNRVPQEYLQGSKPWLIPDSELPIEYKSRWEDEKTSKRR